MAHFLSLDRYDRTLVLGKPWAMVTVELVARKRLQVQADALWVAKADVEWYPLPAGFEVVGGESWPPVLRHGRVCARRSHGHNGVLWPGARKRPVV